MNGGRGSGRAEDEFKLFPELGMVPPLPRHFDHFPGGGIDQVADDRHQIPPTVNFNLGHGIVALFAEKGHPLYLTL
jgi:hypothetical protein